MRTLRLHLILGAIMAMAVPLCQVNAQMLTGNDNARHFGPFIEPDTFRPDFQFFAPADVSNYSPVPDGPTGFFFTYDRIYINVTRPDSPSTPLPSESYFTILPPEPDVNVFVSEPSTGFDGDFTWGNRLELGFMNEDENGWSIVGWHIDGPNQENTTEQGDRLAFQAEVTDIPGAFPADTGAIPFIDPPALDETNQRFADSISDAPLKNEPLIIGQSVNLADFSSIEITKVLHRHYFHNGGGFEPLVGVRFMKFNDVWRNRRYLRGDFNQGGADDTEVYVVNETNNENNLLGGQLGFRMFKASGHWKLSSEFRMFGTQNFQFTHATINEYYWLGSDGPRGDPLISFQRRYSAGTDNSEFVWGGELKMEAEYKLTRDINFRTGFVFLDLAQGISRGNSIQQRDQLGNLQIRQGFNDQDVQMFGMTFGLDINR